MHNHAHHKATCRTTGKMQRRTLLHPQVLHQPPLRKKVRRQLHRAPEAGANHGRAHTPVQPTHALAPVDLRQAVPRVAVVVLGADGPEGGIALQARLGQEKGAAGGGADDARPRAAKHVDAQALRLVVVKERARQRAAHGLVEAQPAAVEQDLVDVGAPQPAVDAADALVAHDDGHAVDRAAVVVWLVALVLELALELHADLDGLEGVGGCHGAARGDAAGEEGAAGKRAVLAVLVMPLRHGPRSAHLPGCGRHGDWWV